MKKYIIPLLLLSFLIIKNTSAQTDGNKSSSGQITIDLFTQIYNPNGYQQNYYFIDASYRPINNVDVGLYYGKDFVFNGKGNKSGISLKYSFNSLVLNNNNKFDIYTKILTGLYWYEYTYTYPTTIIYKETKLDFNFYGGFKYYPINWLGVFTEVGYQKYYDNKNKWALNLGLSFRIK